MAMAQRVPRLSRSDTVYDYLKTQILSLKLKPKDKISESQICQKTDASRTPVREAIGQLVHEGLLYVLPQRGTFVAPIYVNEFLQAHFVRTAIELAILEKAVICWNEEFTAEALNCISEQQHAMQSQDYENFYQQDHRFHHVFARAAGMSGVTSYIDQTRLQLTRVRSLIVSKPGHMKAVISEHLAILHAVKSGDVEKSLLAMKYHLDTIFTTLTALQNEYESFFAD